MQNVFTLETNKYAIKIENFQGPLDLLCHLIDKNKMSINDIKINEITQQYIDYINKMEEMNLEVTSEFLVMASTLIYIKSKSLLPKQVDEEKELTEEELIARIIEYKKYKEITKLMQENYDLFSKRYFKQGEVLEFPKQKIEKKYEKQLISDLYGELINRNIEKINVNAKNIERIAITENFTVSSKVKQIFKELIRKPKFVFNTLFSIKKCNKNEVVTAFTGLLELTRRNKVIANQEELFGDIVVEKAKKIS